MARTSTTARTHWLGLAMGELVLVIVVAACICIGIGVFAMTAPNGANLTAAPGLSEKNGEPRVLRAAGPIKAHHQE